MCFFQEGTDRVESGGRIDDWHCWRDDIGRVEVVVILLEGCIVGFRRFDVVNLDSLRTSRCSAVLPRYLQPMRSISGSETAGTAPKDEETFFSTPKITRYGANRGRNNRAS